MSGVACRWAAIGMGCTLFCVGSLARGGESRPTVKDSPPKVVASPGANVPSIGGTTKGGPHPGGALRPADGGARRAIAGAMASDDLSFGAESAELRSLRDAERELFPIAAPPSGNLSSPDIMTGGDDSAPTVVATGLPPRTPLPAPADEGAGLAWLEHLTMPDLPVRWDERVLRYLRFFRDDPRGHATFAGLYRRSGRWRDAIRRALRRKSLPEDLAWVSMIESGFDAGARSVAGAAGLWQFMPETAKIYGLKLDRWVDQRLDPAAETDAAAEFLADLHRRFGSWELTLAAFNMGTVGLSSVVRRYNTNDFWSLARTEGTLPWETTLYVPKVIAVALVARNLSAFGFVGLTLDAPVETDDVHVPPGTALATVAEAIGCTAKEIEAYNAQFRAARTPPTESGDLGYAVHVPRGKGAIALPALARLRNDLPLERYVVRFGETVAQIAAARKTSVQRIQELNAMGPNEAVRGGTVLLVPRIAGSPAGDGPPADDAASIGMQRGAQSVPPSAPDRRPRVVVPADVFVYPDRKRVFYRVIAGDTLRDVAVALHCTQDDLRRWNDLDPSARLEDAMTLQAFVAPDTDLSRVVVMNEDEVAVLPVGSDEFFAALERDRGFKRVIVVAKAGETLEGIGRRFDVPIRTMERVNRRSRTDALRGGEAVVVYAPIRAADVDRGRLGPRIAGATGWGDRRPAGVGAPAGRSGFAEFDDSVPGEPTPSGRLPPPPMPDLLPAP